MAAMDIEGDDFTQKMLCNNLLIGRIITQATTLEGIIDAYISDFYTRCPANGNYEDSYLAFIYDVLYEQSVSLYTKVQILFKIHRRIYGNPVPGSTKKIFENWISIRNKIAHGKNIDSAILYKGESYEIKDLAEQHAQAQVKILAALQAYQDLQGPYFNHFPIKKTER